MDYTVSHENVRRFYFGASAVVFDKEFFMTGRGWLGNKCIWANQSYLHDKEGHTTKCMHSIGIFNSTSMSKAL